MIRLLKPGANGIRPVDTIDTVDDRLISELLRLDGPEQAVGRTATRDQILGGVAIYGWGAGSRRHRRRQPRSGGLQLAQKA
ncbi:MAG TPA: hypothetical protein VGO77_14440 [Mycobacterium sp.]|nr:hypothetical protein [Mycobacterium sp.]